MNCSNARALMSRSLDGELDNPKVEKLRRHTQACPDCAEYERRILAVDDLVDSLPRPHPPENYAASLKKAVRDDLEAGKTGSNRKTYRWAFRVAASVAFVALTAAVVGLRLEVRSLERTLTQWQRDRGAVPMPDPGVAGHTAPLDFSKNGVVGEQLQVFRAVQEDLGGRLRWLAADGRQVEIGLSGSLEEPPDRRAGERAFVFAFRFVRVETNGARLPVSQPYVTVYPGAEARVRLKPTDGRDHSRFLYQVKAREREDGRVAAEVAFSWSAEQEPGAVEQVVWLTRTRIELEERVIVLLGQCLHEGHAYELWGSVSSRKLPSTAQGEAT